MNTPNWVYRICVTFFAFIVALTAQAEERKQAPVPSLSGTAFSYTPAYPGGFRRNPRAIPASCSAFVPADAVTHDSFKLCQSDHSGKDENYACQTFVAADGRYRVLFKGGRHPRAIAKVAENGDVAEMLWSENGQAPQPVCHFPPPIKVPAETSFKGAGVCLDEGNRSIPCTVFHHKAARTDSVYDYLIFYKPDGSGPDYMQSIYLGENKDAMAAELAYQIGLGLLKTECCQQSGLQYVAHAYQLYPGSTLYRTAYHYYKQQVSRDVLPDALLADKGEQK